MYPFFPGGPVTKKMRYTCSDDLDNCMVMGLPCVFKGAVLADIVSVQVLPAPPVVAPVVVPIAAPVAPVVAPLPVPITAPTVSANLVNGVIIITANNIAANTPVQIVHDLTGDDGVIDLTHLWIVVDLIECLCMPMYVYSQ